MGAFSNEGSPALSMGKAAPKSPELRKEWESLDTLTFPTTVVDGTGRSLFFNKAWQKAPFGKRSRKPPVGDPYLKLCAEHLLLPAPEQMADGLSAVLEGRREWFEVEYVVHPPRRKARRMRVSINPLKGKEGALLAHIDLGVLETDGRLRDQRLSDNFLNETTDAVFFCDHSGRLAMANPVTGRWFDAPVDQLIGQPANRIQPPDLSRMLLEQNAECMESGENRTFELTCATAHGQRTFLVTKGIHHSPTGKFRGVFGIARDVSEIKAMEREIIDMSDKEKQRLGQELHENLCQYLVGISLLGNVLYEDLLKLRLKQADDARQITRLVKESITEVRALVKGLSPMPVEQDEGLFNAFQELAEQARSIGKVRCTVRFPRTAEPLDATTSIHLFRIAQEAVHNAIKHSQATRLRIRLASQRRALVLTVEDNGVGFSRTESTRSEMGLGLGLHIMQYRSRAIGGELEICRIEPQGTRVRCTVPKTIRQR